MEFGKRAHILNTSPPLIPFAQEEVRVMTEALHWMYDVIFKTYQSYPTSRVLQETQERMERIFGKEDSQENVSPPPQTLVILGSHHPLPDGFPIILP